MTLLSVSARNFQLRSIFVTLTCFLGMAFSGVAMAAQPGSESHINEAIGKAYASYGVSEAVRAGDFLFIGGIVAFDDDGNVIAPNDGIKQMEVIYGYIKKILADHGATARNIVNETHFANNMDEYFAGAAVRLKFYDDAGAAYPTSVLTKVAGLVDPGLVVEIKVIAYLGE